MSKLKEHKQCCWRKVKQPDRTSAEVAADELHLRRGEMVKAYRCLACGFWHVGKPGHRQRRNLERSRRRFGYK